MCGSSHTQSDNCSKVTDQAYDSRLDLVAPALKCEESGGKRIACRT
jgi:hypothetical protein